MSKTNLLGYSSKQLQELIISLGGKSYGGKQLFKWLYKMREYEFGNMTDLSKDIRQKLENGYEFKSMKPHLTQKSVDGTTKYLFKLEDDKPIEMVLIPEYENNRKTVCISSQVGCALACKFCATGTMGLLRDLTVGEIIGQLIYLRDEFGDQAFTNIVMMGMGEPLNNYQNVLEALKLMTDKDALNMGPRKVTVSTSGVTPKIKKLADSGVRVCLALSLHAATQEKREQIMPIARTFSLNKVMEAVKYHAEKTNTFIMLEYILIDGFNDTEKDIKDLGKLAHGHKCKINVLGYNPVEGLGFKRPSEEKLDWFGGRLRKYFYMVTVRKSRGRDIDAACGQLAAKQKKRSKADAG